MDCDEMANKSWEAGANSYTGNYAKLPKVKENYGSYRRSRI
jgi:hypothetical protein